MPPQTEYSYNLRRRQHNYELHKNSYT